MTEKELDYIRKRKAIKTNWKRDWLQLLISAVSIVSVYFIIEWAFDDYGPLTYLYLALLLGFVIIHNRAIQLKYSFSQISALHPERITEVLKELQVQNWNLIDDQNNLYQLEKIDGSSDDLVIFLVEEKTIYFNNHPKGIRPFAQLKDFKTRKELIGLVRAHCGQITNPK